MLLLLSITPCKRRIHNQSGWRRQSATRSKNIYYLIHFEPPNIFRSYAWTFCRCGDKFNPLQVCYLPVALCRNIPKLNIAWFLFITFLKQKLNIKIFKIGFLWYHYAQDLLKFLNIIKCNVVVLQISNVQFGKDGGFPELIAYQILLHQKIKRRQRIKIL